LFKHIIGVPVWAAIPTDDKFHRAFPFPLQTQPFPVENSTGFPSWQECAKFYWADYQLTEACSSAYQNLYDNKNGLLDSLAQYWKRVATTFIDSPNILGYDLFNEPFAGDVFEHPSLLIPGNADRQNLQGVYDTIVPAIRAVDAHRTVFMESITWDDFSVGFTHVPMGADYTNRTGLSYHLYIPPMLGIEETFIVRRNDLKMLGGIAGLLTEFDISYKNGTNVPYMIEVMNTAERFKQSWMGWQYKPFHPYANNGWSLINVDGSVNQIVAKSLARTYATVVAGKLQNSTFNSETGEFTMHYKTSTAATTGKSHNEGCSTTTTIVYVNQKYYYPQGLSISTEPASIVTWTLVDEHYIHFEHKTSGSESVLVTVSIAKKN